MTHDEVMARLQAMADGDPRWDLMPGDRQALAYVLKWTKDLQMVCDNRGRREEEGRARIAELEKAGRELIVFEWGDPAKGCEIAPTWQAERETRTIWHRFAELVGMLNKGDGERNQGDG